MAVPVMVGCTSRNGVTTYDHCLLEEFSPTSPKHIFSALTRVYGWEPSAYTKTGKAKLDTETLTNAGFPLTDLIVSHRKLYKAHSAFIVRYAADLETSEDGRLHPEFPHTRTLTGRLSSKNPNMQQVPSKGEIGAQVRQLVVAPKGFKVVGCDLSNIEGRVLAYYLAKVMGDFSMAEIFRQGLDFHSMNTINWGLAPGYTYEQVRDKVDGLAAFARNSAKTLLYAICYGAGARKVGGGDLDKGRSLIKTLEDNCPALPELKRRVIQQAIRRGGTVYDLFGRRLHYPCLDPKEAWKEAYKMQDALQDMSHEEIAKWLRSRAERQVFNALLQGTAASIFKKIQVSVYKRLKDVISSGEVEFVAPVHDELLLYVKRTKVDYVLQVLREEFSMDVFGGLVPMCGDPASGDNWGEVH